MMVGMLLGYGMGRAGMDDKVRRLDDKLAEHLAADPNHERTTG